MIPPLCPLLMWATSRVWLTAFAGFRSVPALGLAALACVGLSQVAGFTSPRPVGLPPWDDTNVAQAKMDCKGLPPCQHIFCSNGVNPSFLGVLCELPPEPPQTAPRLEKSAFPGLSAWPVACVPPRAPQSLPERTQPRRVYPCTPVASRGLWRVLCGLWACLWPVPCGGCLCTPPGCKTPPAASCGLAQPDSRQPQPRNPSRPPLWGYPFPYKAPVTRYNAI